MREWEYLQYVFHFAVSIVPPKLKKKKKMYVNKKKKLIDFFFLIFLLFSYLHPGMGTLTISILG